MSATPLMRAAKMAARTVRSWSAAKRNYAERVTGDDDGLRRVYGIIDPDYGRVFSIARCLAWSEGYALLFHGSFTRDLDLIAVPWTASACPPEHLLRRFATATDLNVLTKEPGCKEHGRLAWTLTFKGFGDPRFIDFSIMPRLRATPPDSGTGGGGA